MYPANTEAEFWPRVAAPDRNGCRAWIGSRHRRGYGRVRFNRQPQQAHRVAYELTHGPIPDGMLVCHTCDNPPCCEPSHLFLGTAQDNMTDKVAKNRHLWGELNPRAKLVEDDVRLIRSLYASGGCTHSALAKQFGVSPAAVRFLLSGKSWKHVR